MRTGKAGTTFMLTLLVVGGCTFMVYQAGEPAITAVRDSGRGSPVVPPELNPAELAVAEDQRKVAEAFFKDVMESGAVRKVKAQVVWVEPLVWAMMNRDEKEATITNCAAAMAALGGTPTVTIKSYANDRTLGGHGVLRGTYINP